MSDSFIKFTCPVGSVYIRKDHITAFSDLKTVGARTGTATKSNVWVIGQDESFHVFEDVDAILKAVSQ